MIVFDLACATNGHVFEGWFGSTGDYEDQRARGLLTCPLCGDSGVEKALMAPRVSPKGNSDRKALITALATAQAKMLEGSDYVGPRFADEALAIHLGESDARAIHGQATPAEAASLIDEGIAVAPLPLPIRPPGTDN